MYNAGVLLYSIRNGDVVFLLGKDAKWRQWSDFGGKNDINDKNKEDNVARSLKSSNSSSSYETEAYYLEDKPEKVLHYLKKFCF